MYVMFKSIHLFTIHTMAQCNHTQLSCSSPRYITILCNSLSGVSVDMLLFEEEAKVLQRALRWQFRSAITCILIIISRVYIDLNLAVFKLRLCEC